jgi:hypothetical protein
VSPDPARVVLPPTLVRYSLNEQRGHFDELSGFAVAAEKSAADHPDQVEAAVQKLEGVVDEKTGGRHHGQVVQAGAKAEQSIARQAGFPQYVDPGEASAL